MRCCVALIIAAAAAVALMTGVAFAAGEAEHPHDDPFSFDSPVGVYDMGAVQRGFQVYQQVCAACHSMNHLAYRHLGEEGGPFALYRVRNHETGEEELHVGRPEHGGTLRRRDRQSLCPRHRGWRSDLRHRSQRRLSRPIGRGASRITSAARSRTRSAARSSNGGAFPPDLSVITSARHGGADYIVRDADRLHWRAARHAAIREPVFPRPPDRDAAAARTTAR